MRRWGERCPFLQLKVEDEEEHAVHNGNAVSDSVLGRQPAPYHRDFNL